MTGPQRPPITIDELAEGFSAVENHAPHGGYTVDTVFVIEVDKEALQAMGQFYGETSEEYTPTGEVFGTIWNTELRVDAEIDPLGWKRIRLVSEPGAADNQVVTVWI